jgi:hypothetical protein
MAFGAEGEIVPNPHAGRKIERANERDNFEALKIIDKSSADHFESHKLQFASRSRGVNPYC